MQRRYITQKQKIINALKDAAPEGVTNSDLAKISLRYGAHLGILYRQGYRVNKLELDGGLVKYFLMSEPSNTQYFNNAQEEVLAEMGSAFGREISGELEKLLEDKHFHIIRKNGWYQNFYAAENQMPFN